jgi:hypothetical protein
MKPTPQLSTPAQRFSQCLKAAAAIVAAARAQTPKGFDPVNAVYTNLTDINFAEKALQGFVATLLPLNAFSTNFEPTPVPPGNTVIVPLIGAVTATTFGGAYNVCGGTMTGITVTINRHKVVQIGQSDLTAASSSVANLDRFAFQQGAGLAIAVLQDVFTLLTTANFAIASSLGNQAFGVTTILKGRTDLNNNKAPAIGRALVLDVAPYSALLSLTTFNAAYAFGSTDPLREGSIARVLGFDVYETNGLPGTNSVMGFVAVPAAIAIANRYLQPQDTTYYRDARPVSDPNTGATFGIRRHYDPNTGTEYVNMECNYGYAAGITTGAELYVRTD